MALSVYVAFSVQQAALLFARKFNVALIHHSRCSDLLIALFGDVITMFASQVFM